ncbi:hypothetical protein [Candidatus Uabimicrobium sp. HlEnr_7]|uniref:hypothetical protein n=1 Tax=Candidatus Uabimicrobium helgolandensis TaxID=3095367 RepID=UPI0035561429
MLKPQPLISFWNGSSQTLRSYLNMDKRVYGMFGTNYKDGFDTYFMQFKTGKDGVNDTSIYLSLDQLHGRITPILVENKKILLLDFWEFREEQVLPFLKCLETSIDYHLSHTPTHNENNQTALMLVGTKVSIGGSLLSKDGQDYQIAYDKIVANMPPPLMEINLD